jgi:hypothetical protein
VRFAFPPFAKSAKDGAPEPLVAAEARKRQSFDRASPSFRPTYAGANVGHPCRSVVGTARGLRGRPMGHPAIVAGIEARSATGQLLSGRGSRGRR